jgi:hypothetical protein
MPYGIVVSTRSAFHARRVGFQFQAKKPTAPYLINRGEEFIVCASDLFLFGHFLVIWCRSGRELDAWGGGSVWLSWPLFGAFPVLGGSSVLRYCDDRGGELGVFSVWSRSSKLRAANSSVSSSIGSRAMFTTHLPGKGHAKLSSEGRPCVLYLHYEF